MPGTLSLVDICKLGRKGSRRMLFAAGIRITLWRPPYGYGVCFSMTRHERRPIMASRIISLQPLASLHSVPPKIATATVAAAIIFLVAGTSTAEALQMGPQQLQQQDESGAETLSNIPQTLSGKCLSGSGQQEDCKRARIQRPKSRKAETCTVKCVATCIRGGLGSPGEGPLNIRRPLVVFKQGFRSRRYCLMECSDICNLIGDGDDGP